MSIDNKTKTLIVNQVTKEQYKTLVDNSQLIPTELYVIVDDAHYTEQEIITLLMAKQDVLSAGLGVQIVDNTITFDMSNDFYTKEDITELLATKSNVTEAGYTLEYEENYLNLKTIDGEVLSSIIIKSAPDTDGVTISYNDNKELQTIGQITKNNTPKFSWIGTQEEYDRDLEAGIIDEYTECLITDSVSDIIAPVVSFDAPTKLSELANDMNFVVQSDLQSVKDELQADIEAGIDDTNLVHKTGNETIEGFKNFKEKIVIENGLNKGRIAHKTIDTSLEDGYIEFGDNTLVYGKQDVQGEVFDEKHDIFHAGNLVAGNNITITKKNGVYKINGQAGGGTGGGSIDNVDNETIIIQDDGSISAQGVLDQNTEDLTAIKFWSGTLEEYNALGEWDDDTIYNVTDDIIETGTEIGANLSLSNLNEEGEARFDAKADKADTLEGYGIANGLNKNQITNCITEIPQRVKYTLVDGTLTILAGSVVIVPYGTEDLTSQYPKGATFINDNFKVYDTQFADGKFFVWAEIQNDKTLNLLNRDTVDFVFYTFSDDKLAFSTYSNSGDAQPSAITLWYNTLNNNVNKASTTAIELTDCTLPLMIINNKTDITQGSVDQVFNGIGYIGSILFLDKGVKFLIPNGRNEDGTLNNIEYKTTKVFTRESKGITDSTRTFMVFDIQSIGNPFSIATIFQGFCMSQPTPTLYGSYFNVIENAWYYSADGIYWDKRPWGCLGTLFLSSKSDNIDIFKPYKPFRAVDYSDSSTVSSWNMPSNKHINLTLGASGTTYTAPANGWFHIVKAGTNGKSEYINVRYDEDSDTDSEYIYSHNTDKEIYPHLGVALIPATKGKKIVISYTMTGTTYVFRFIYAQGEV